MFPFIHISSIFLFYTRFPLSCNCVNSSSPILIATPIIQLMGLCPLLSHLAPLPHMFSTISYLFYYCGFTLCSFLTWHPLFLISFPYSNGTTRTYWYWLVFGWRVQCINYGFLLIFSAPSFTTFYPASCAVVYHRGFLLSEGECQAVMWKNMFYWNSVLSCVGQVLSRSISYPLLRKYGWHVSLS